MLRRSLATVSLAAGLLTTTGCMCIELPTFPRLRSLLPGGRDCPPGVVCDVEGPILLPGEAAPVSTSTSGPASGCGTRRG